MKKVLLILLLVVQFGEAQFKNSQQNIPSVSSSFLRPMSLNDYQSLIDPSKLLMRHSFSMSYVSMGNQNMMLNSYNNSMFYKFADNLIANVDISVQNSPINNLDPRIANQFSGVFLNNVALVYKPFKDFEIGLSYQQSPYSNFYRDRLLFDNQFGK